MTSQKCLSWIASKFFQWSVMCLWGTLLFFIPWAMGVCYPPPPPIFSMSSFCCVLEPQELFFKHSRGCPRHDAGFRMMSHECLDGWLRNCYQCSAMCLWGTLLLLDPLQGRSQDFEKGEANVTEGGAEGT